LDKLAKFYAWFLLVTTVLPALLRLALPDRVADITLVRFKKPGGQKRYRVLPLFFLFYPDQRWILFAIAVGVLSGGEMFVNASWPETLIPQNRAFGAVYAIAAVAVYWFLLRG
jgi:hypothetical protein